MMVIGYKIEYEIKKLNYQCDKCGIQQTKQLGYVFKARKFPLCKTCFGNKNINIDIKPIIRIEKTWGITRSNVCGICNKTWFTYPKDTTTQVVVKKGYKTIVNSIICSDKCSDKIIVYYQKKYL